MIDITHTQGEAIVRKIVTDAGPPRAAHLMLWTRVNEQILIEVGYFDLAALHAQAQQVTSAGQSQQRTVDWFVTDRFILDFESAGRILDAFKDLGKAIEQYREREGADAIPASSKEAR